MIVRLRLWIILAVCCLPAPVAGDERILDYRSHIKVNENGYLAVTETIRVQAEGNKINRGIYRDFPTRYKDKLGNHFVVDFDVISVQRDGRAEPWHTEKKSNGVRVYMGSANRKLQPGMHEYEISFVTNRQLGFFSDHDELWWNVTGNGWNFPIDRRSGTQRLHGAVRLKRNQRNGRSP
jgi:hypothetical protein